MSWKCQQCGNGTYFLVRGTEVWEKRIKEYYDYTIDSEDNIEEQDLDEDTELASDFRERQFDYSTLECSECHSRNVVGEEDYVENSDEEENSSSSDTLYYAKENDNTNNALKELKNILIKNG